MFGGERARRVAGAGRTPRRSCTPAGRAESTPPWRWRARPQPAAPRFAAVATHSAAARRCRRPRPTRSCGCGSVSCSAARACSSSRSGAAGSARRGACRDDARSPRLPPGAEQQGGDPVPRHHDPSRRARSQPAACAPKFIATVHARIGDAAAPDRHRRSPSRALMACGAVLVGQAIWIHAKAVLAQVLLERAFAATLATGHDVKPWSWADTWPVARVVGPAAHRSAIVLAGASGQALAFGPGHVERTPEAGEPGTAIYSAPPRHALRLPRRGRDRRRDRGHAARRRGISAFASPAPRWCAGMPPASIRSRPAAGSCSSPAGRSTESFPARCAMSCTPRWWRDRRGDRVLQGG